MRHETTSLRALGTGRHTISLLATACVLSGLTACVHVHRPVQCYPKLEPPAKTAKSGRSSVGLAARMDAVGGRDLVGAGIDAGFVFKGRWFTGNIEGGLSLDGMDRVYGLSVGAGLRWDWEVTSLVYPKFEAVYTNYSGHWGENRWRPRWLIDGDLGVEFVVARPGNVELVLTPLVALGMTSRDVAYHEGAQKLTRTRNEFFYGARIGFGVLFW